MRLPGWRSLFALAASVSLFAAVESAGAATPTCDGKAATIVGTAGADRLLGTEGSDVIVGLAGRDRISGLGGRDSICGGRNADVLRGGDGRDFVAGLAGHDTIFGGPGADRLHGGMGSDQILAGRGSDLLKGGRGQDYLFGGRGDDRLRGRAGNDNLDGWRGDDASNGGRGLDACFAETRVRCEPLRAGGTLSPGTYTTSQFTPRFSFTLARPWDTSGDIPGYFSLFPAGPTPWPDVFDFLRVRKVWSPRTGNKRSVPANLVAWLRSHPALETETPVAVTVGGASGFRLDTRVVSLPNSVHESGCPCFRLFEAGTGTWYLLRGERARFYVIHVGDRRVVIAVETRSDRFPALLARAERVIDTVDFSP